MVLTSEALAVGRNSVQWKPESIKKRFKHRFENRHVESLIWTVCGSELKTGASPAQPILFLYDSSTWPQMRSPMPNRTHHSHWSIVSAAVEKNTSPNCTISTCIAARNNDPHTQSRTRITMCQGQCCGLRLRTSLRTRPVWDQTKSVLVLVLQVWCCVVKHTRSCHARHHNDLENHSNFSRTISYSFSILCLEHHYCGDQQWHSLT